MTTNSVLTPTLIADKMLDLLDNNLVFGNLVSREYQAEFSGSPKPGESITIRKPALYTVRTGKTASFQDSVEGSTTLTLSDQIGVDIKFSSRDMTLSIEKFADRYLKDPAIKLANAIEVQMATLYRSVPQWAGTPGQVINSFADFAKGPQMMDELAMGSDRVAVLSPADAWGLVGNLSGLYVSDVAKSALEKAKIPMLGGVDVYSTQVVINHTVGTYGGTSLTNGAAQETTYAASKTTGTQTLITDGWSSGATTLNAGDVFTIAGVYAVNPVTKSILTYLKQFTVVNTISDTTGNITLTMRPAAILTGAHQNVSATIGDNAAITIMGTSATAYPQNLMFNKDAFALVTVPMELPQGAVLKSRRTYKGISMRVIQGYDIINDDDMWRFDVLPGYACVDPRLAVRISGTA